MGVSFTAKVYVGFLVEPAELFVETTVPPFCPKGHAPKAGEAFCPIDGGRFEGRVLRSFRAPVAAYLERRGLKVDPDDLDGWLWPRKGYEGIEIFDARAHTNCDDRGAKVLALGFEIGGVGLDDQTRRDPAGLSLSEAEQIAAKCRAACDELGIWRAPEVRIFLTGYTGY